MNNFEIINFNERMEFQVYKCGGCSHDNIGDEIIDGSVILEILNGSVILEILNGSVILEILNGSL
jgi:hypothetical protein